MAKTSILVVDDEEDIRELVGFHLNREGFEVLFADSGEKAIDTAQAKLPNLLVLDLMLPGLDGLEVCKKLKSSSKTMHIPIIMLTAKGEESDIVSGLELGADDYITKPFSPKVLVARIRAILRRKTEGVAERKPARIHELIIDPLRYEVLVKNKPVELTLTEFNILYTLIKRAGLVLTRYQIVDSIHGENYLVTDRAIDVQIVSLRKKLGSAEKYIETVRGVGYRFKD